MLWVVHLSIIFGKLNILPIANRKYFGLRKENNSSNLKHKSRHKVAQQEKLEQEKKVLVHSCEKRLAVSKMQPSDLSYRTLLTEANIYTVYIYIYIEREYGETLLL